MKKCVLDVDFLGSGSEEKLGLISRRTHRCFRSCDLVKKQQDMLPQMKGVLCWKKNLEQTLAILITKHVWPY